MYQNAQPIESPHLVQVKERALPCTDTNRRRIEAPHVVILGAGASRAAFPKGDASGKKLPLMNELVEILDLTGIIEEQGYNGDTLDFESFYSDIVDKEQYILVLSEIQNRVRSYFETLQIPNEVTLYDYLILSLREKDIIATFNWDPLLLQAYRRSLDLKPLPELAFLHGNVYEGMCEAHKRVGYLGSVCEICREKLQPVQLLYPTSRKDYNKDPVIKGHWDRLTDYLDRSYFLTIFGYRAPRTDIEARNMMYKAWSGNKLVELAQTEIIDIEDAEVVYDRWQEFIVRQHCTICESFQESWLWSYPRQTCEALFDATMQGSPRNPTPFPKTPDLGELHDFVSNLKSEDLHV
jgi:hypothetical protein